jgi:hypothetical protein
MVKLRTLKNMVKAIYSLKVVTNTLDNSRMVRFMD